MKPSPEAVLLVLGAAAHLMIVLCHRTLGGWQFGNRYIVDLLPYVFCGIGLRDAAKQGIRRLVQGALLHRCRGQCRRNDIGLWTLDLIDIQNSGADDETGAAV